MPYFYWVVEDSDVMGSRIGLLLNHKSVRVQIAGSSMDGVMVISYRV
jgi:hypothetical protein